jgi:hypothetical protein
MMQDLTQRTQALAALIEAKYGTRGKDFAAKVRRLGRGLSKGLRVDAAVIIHALSVQGHPKLGAQLDGRKLEQAFQNLEDHLAKVDALDRRIGQAISITASFAFGLIVLAGLTLAVLWSRGLF